MLSRVLYIRAAVVVVVVVVGAACDTLSPSFIGVAAKTAYNSRSGGVRVFRNGCGWIPFRTVSKTSHEGGVMDRWIIVVGSR